ncbi:GNAT family N-acetyltransferase [Ningiella sp. W23]|uniref:GNAT family N-acetyltransferase n=1 Tax=Ningiella sp. W23 TaxID=3023715 RepID=UPI003756621D
MIFRLLNTSEKFEVQALFTNAFSAAEGDEEGKMVGELSLELASNIDNTDILCLGAYENKSLIGSIFFTRLMFDEPTLVYMLAPVAVSAEHQGIGVGQSLIRYGLTELANRSVAVTVTYGDPGFYSKLGFQALSESIIQAPLTLSMPHGWLAQSLTEQAIRAISDRPTCVKPFNNQAYW